jgi:hypothetical protein
MLVMLIIRELGGHFGETRTRSILCAVQAVNNMAFSVHTRVFFNERCLKKPNSLKRPTEIVTAVLDAQHRQNL